MTPPRVVIVNLDDARWDDLHTVMQSGPRAGERVLEQTITRVIERGTTFAQMRSDLAYCGPSRASLYTGLTTNNHGQDGNNPPEYYLVQRDGTSAVPWFGSTAQWMGPHELDLALIHQATIRGWGPGDSITQEPVVAESQGSVGGKTNGRRYSASSPANSHLKRGDTTDDLQAFTGNWATWLAHEGVVCALIGKHQNGFATGNLLATSYFGDNTLAYGPGVKEDGTGAWGERTLADVEGDANWTKTPATCKAALAGIPPVVSLAQRYVPPGWSYWRALVGNATSWGGGSQDHYNVKFASFTGDNPATGYGVEADAIVYAPYQIRPVTITRSAQVATVDVGAGQTHGMVKDDEFAIEDTTSGDWSGTYTSQYTDRNGKAWTRTHYPVVLDVIDARRFTYTLHGAYASLPTSAPGSNIKLYVRNNYGEGRWRTEAIRFMESMPDERPFLLYFAPDNPHEAIVGSEVTPTLECERRYLNTINEMHAHTFNGVAGWLPDASGPCAWSSSSRTVTASGRRWDGKGPFLSTWVGREVTDRGETIVQASAQGGTVRFILDTLAGTGAATSTSTKGWCNRYAVGRQVRAQLGTLHGHDVLDGLYTITAVGTMTYGGNTCFYVEAAYGGADFNVDRTAVLGTGNLAVVIGTVASVGSDLPGATSGTLTLTANATYTNPGYDFAASGEDFLTIGVKITDPVELDVYANSISQRDDWARRQEMLASTDDTIAGFLDAAKARGWQISIIFTNDNGWQQGEHNTVEDLGPGNDDMWRAKNAAWEGSIRSVLSIYHPRWGTDPRVVLFPVSHYDLAPTILDLFAVHPSFAHLADHHCHQKRDGQSIVRLLADLDAAGRRAQLIHDGYFDGGQEVFHGYGNRSPGDGIIVKDVNPGWGFPGVAKLVRHWQNSPDTNTRHLFNVYNDGFAYPDYEQTDLLAQFPHLADELDRRLDLLHAGRWRKVGSSWVQTFREQTGWAYGVARLAGSVTFTARGTVS